MRIWAAAFLFASTPRFCFSYCSISSKISSSFTTALPQMSAVTTQFNPDAAAGDEIFVFYNDKDALLGFELVKAESSDVVTYNSASINTKGFIRNPSQLAAIHFQNVMRVYAIDDVDSNVVLISPGLKNLDISTEKTYGSLAACGNGGNHAWLFYLKGNPCTIRAYDLKTKVPTAFSFSNILDGSYLGACYDTINSKVHVVYQSNDNPCALVHAQGTSGENAEAIISTDTAAGNTPIAVCAHPKRTQIQIYFKNNADSMVHRVSWNPAEKSPYSDPTEVGEAAMDSFSGVSAVAAPDGSGVHVFYVYDQDEETRAVAHVVDNWHTPSN